MGRAPSSGNCHTCRARRVKCDKARPACARCLKGGFACAGYESVLRMQNHAAVAGAEPGSSRLAKVQAMSSFPAAATTTTTAAAAGGKRAPRRVAGPETSAREVGVGDARPSPEGTDARRRRPRNGSRPATGQEVVVASTSVPAELSLSPFADDISFSYFFQAYDWNGWINMHSILLQDTAMRRHLSSEAMSLDCLRALSYGLLGRDHHIDSLKHYGYRLYGTMLQSLRTKLTSSSKTELAELIRPIAIMGSYAVSVENDLRFTHNRGLTRILEHCGPEAFQSPELLPVFESCRLSLISASIVGRERSFLAEPQWKTVPWEKLPEQKTPISKLLDIMAEIPGIIEGAWAVMRDRIAWINSGFESARYETPDTVPQLQARVSNAREALKAWLVEWEAANSDGGSELLAWTFRVAEDDDYRPGIGGLEGPDVYETSMLFDLFPERGGAGQPAVNEVTFARMQDMAYYTTVLIWTTRLVKFLSGAARSPTSTSFFNTPFFTSCTCCTSTSPVLCQTIPSTRANAKPSLTWNITAAKLASSPVRNTSAPYSSYSSSSSSSPSKPPAAALSFSSSSSSTTASTATPSPPTDKNSNLTSSSSCFSSSSPSTEHSFADTALLLPGDVRFAAQLRLLSWLVDRLPLSRGYVLGALAAIGLAHCAHDVRPAEGIAAVATAVGRVLDRTGVEGADGLLLRKYR